MHRMTDDANSRVLSRSAFRLKLAGAIGLAFGTAACSSATGTPGTKPTIPVAVVMPFSGPNASFGPLLLSGCLPAIYLINKAGGVAGGDKLSCTSIDTVGDPVDGVAAVRKALASTSDLAGVLGPDGGTADAVVPIFNGAHVAMMASNGGSEFDQNKYQYYWRVVPADSMQGTGMAIAAHDAGYTRVGLIFGSDTSSQTEVPPLVAALKKLNIAVTINEAITPNQANYSIQVAKLLATHPQAIFEEAEPATAATMWSDLKQQESHPIAVIGDATDTLQPNIKAVVAAVGQSFFSQNFSAVVFYTPPTDPGVSTFNKALLTKAAGVPSPKQYLNSTYSWSFYDATNILALAMDAAHSVTPSVFNKYIPAVTGSGSGNHITVHDYAAGAALLKQGKLINYEGPSGQLRFNQYHNTLTAFVSVGFHSNGSLFDQHIISISEVDQLAS